MSIHSSKSRCSKSQICALHEVHMFLLSQMSYKMATHLYQNNISPVNNISFVESPLKSVIVKTKAQLTKVDSVAQDWPCKPPE